MSVIVGVRKGKEIAIAADTLHSFGSTHLQADKLVNHNKIYRVGKSYIAFSGWTAISLIMEHAIIQRGKLFDFESREKIFDSFLKLHRYLKEEYFIHTEEDEDEQPVESSQISAMVITANGLFSVASYREVNEFSQYWAIGSGYRFALGAAHSLYSTNLSAKGVAIAAVEAAAEFDDGCGLPISSETIALR